LKFEGALDVCRDDLVAGWAWDSEDGDRRVAIDLIVDDAPLTRLAADRYRSDLEDAGRGDGRYGFRYTPPAPLGLGRRKVHAMVAGTDFCLPRSQPTETLDRRERLTRFISRDQRGIEVGPYFRPLAPKRLGYQCTVMDVFDAETLRLQALADSNIPRAAIADIEEVDIIGSAIEIAERVGEKLPPGSFDYVITSHNFEHLPDPIHFLQGCEKVLRPGGILSMAVPDRRTCFDYFRPYSTLADLLDAYFAHRVRPTPAQVFCQNALHSRYTIDGRQLVGFSLADDPANVVPVQTLSEAFAAWKQYELCPDEVYRDVHCWAFTPASLELLLTDLRFLGLIRLACLEISDTVDNEFYVHLVNRGEDQDIPSDSAEFYERRRQLLHKVNDEAGCNSIRSFAQRRQFDSEREELLRRIAELENRGAQKGPSS
jgi:SAM-dependent methyltransferase